jgi:hypothetical protein
MDYNPVFDKKELDRKISHLENDFRMFLEQLSSGTKNQFLANEILKDSISIITALDKIDSGVIQPILKKAAFAGCQLFRWSRINNSECCRNESDGSINDNSFCNLYTLNPLLLLAFIAKDNDALKFLSLLEQKELINPLVSHSPITLKYSEALMNLIRGDIRDFTSKLRALLSLSSKIEDYDDKIWFGQAKLLLALIESDKNSYISASEEYELMISEIYGRKLILNQPKALPLKVFKILDLPPKK